MKRRSFLALSAGFLPLRSARATDAEIIIFPKEPTGSISPFLHGHFIEHLGGVIYDGIWVGENSQIANIGGIRKAVVDSMKALGSTVMRWPGGCFADSYDWMDGIGPSSQRPIKPNFWIDNGRLREVAPSHPSRNDPNHFGTHEFIRFCRLIQAEPYLAANVRSLPAKSFYDWIDYCNSPAGSSTLARRRAAGGDVEPFGVRFWGVGNESWGCGGELTAAEYSVEFRKFTAWAPRWGVPLNFIAAGPNGGDLRWTREFFSRIVDKSPALLNRVWGWALHYYCGTTGKGDSLDFTNEDAYDLVRRADRMQELIEQHWQVMGEVDREHRVKLVVDEWGAWHRDGTAVAPHHLFGSVPTMRDALVAALTLDTFHRHANKVAMANVAQLVNCIQTLFLADGDKFCLTPTYHVFALYRAHQNNQAVRAEFLAPKISYRYEGGERQVVRLAGSASLRSDQLVITAVNVSLSDPLEARILVPGANQLDQPQAMVLTTADIHAHNDFQNPDGVRPQAGKVSASGRELRLTLPPMSVVRIQARLV
ncbi:MAG: alpha-L-arabinofuranosidase [Bryobacteraceae bacterium]|nr:alpha-L-arabinofuranosidase [Bryobacteraceae bacterium]MDW8377155.1 alpha-L-arabinofuranosidase C-terminal domain-containing protein [Bryobacterales bacterium]